MKRKFLAVTLSILTSAMLIPAAPATGLQTFAADAAKETSTEATTESTAEAASESTTETGTPEETNVEDSTGSGSSADSVIESDSGDEVSDSEETATADSDTEETSESDSENAVDGSDTDAEPDGEYATDGADTNADDTTETSQDGESGEDAATTDTEDTTDTVDEAATELTTAEETTSTESDTDTAATETSDTEETVDTAEIETETGETTTTDGETVTDSATPFMALFSTLSDDAAAASSGADVTANAVSEVPTIESLTVPDTISIGDTMTVTAKITAANSLYTVIGGFADSADELTAPGSDPAVKMSLTESGENTYTGNCVVKGITSGAHKFILIATDMKNNTATKEVTITVESDSTDHDAPVVSDFTITPDTIETGDPVKVTAKLTDASDIDACKVTFYSEASRSSMIYDAQLTKESDGATYATVDLPQMTGLAVGKNPVYISARDVQGNETAENQYVTYLTVNGDASDTQGPTVSDLSVTSSLAEGGDFTVTVKVEDASGVKNVWCEIYDSTVSDSTNWQRDLNLYPVEGETNVYKATARIAGLKPGTCRAHIVANDIHGYYTDDQTSATNATFELTGDILSNNGVTISTPDEAADGSKIEVIDVKGNDVSAMASPVGNYVAEQVPGSEGGEVLRAMDIVYYINQEATKVDNTRLVVDIPAEEDWTQNYSAFYVIYLDQANFYKPAEILPAQVVYTTSGTYIEFETTHLSRYVLYGTNVKTTEDSSTDTTTEDNTETTNSSSETAANTTSSNSSSSGSSSSDSSSSTPAPAPVIKSVDVYRLLNPSNGDHFYTTDAEERDALVAEGWTDEGIGWQAPAYSNTSVHRLLNPNTGLHLFTADENEYQQLAAEGWTDEGISWYSAGENGVPIYRQGYNDFHNYTTDTAEKDALVSAGWVDEGIAWYGME